jgi:sugar lactone lactonase YvrE
VHSLRRGILPALAGVLIVVCSGIDLARGAAVSPRRAGGGVQPVRPGPLVAAPDGRLYMGDTLGHRILEWLPGGSFRVVAGTGKAGFSGDGRPAVRAAINSPGGMALGHDGTLYFADEMNGRVRAIAPNGTISTVVGGGAGNGWVKSGTRARGASLCPSAVTIGPDRRLYIASCGNQVLRLERNGTLTQIAGNRIYAGIRRRDAGRPAVNESPADPDGLAFDRAGNLYVAGFSVKVLNVITPGGIMERPVSPTGFYPFGDGGLATAPDGSVIAMNRATIVRLGPKGETTILSFYGRHITGIVGTFEPNGIAVGPDGTIYADTFVGNGYTETTALIGISPSGRIRVLWKA